MFIQFNTEDLKASDLEVLRAIVGGAEAPVAAPKPKAAAPAKKAAKPAPAPEPEPEEDEDEDLLGGGDDLKTEKEAMDLASRLVSEKKGKKVKEALNEVGAARVSEMDSDQIQKFFEILGDE